MLFEKWFGQSTQESDNKVRDRMTEATHLMTKRGDIWTPMCCKTGNGACGPSCQYQGVQAFVENWNYRG
jgi:hypothetical protein